MKAIFFLVFLFQIVFIKLERWHSWVDPFSICLAGQRSLVLDPRKIGVFGWGLEQNKAQSLPNQTCWRVTKAMGIWPWASSAGASWIVATCEVLRNNRQKHQRMSGFLGAKAKATWSQSSKALDEFEATKRRPWSYPAAWAALPEVAGSSRIQEMAKGKKRGNNVLFFGCLDFWIWTLKLTVLISNPKSFCFSKKVVLIFENKLTKAHFIFQKLAKWGMVCFIRSQPPWRSADGLHASSLISVTRQSSTKHQNSELRFAFALGQTWFLESFLWKVLAKKLKAPWAKEHFPRFYFLRRLRSEDSGGAVLDSCLTVPL